MSQMIKTLRLMNETVLKEKIDDFIHSKIGTRILFFSFAGIILMDITTSAQAGFICKNMTGPLQGFLKNIMKLVVYGAPLLGALQSIRSTAFSGSGNLSLSSIDIDPLKYGVLLSVFIWAIPTITAAIFPNSGGLGTCIIPATS